MTKKKFRVARNVFLLVALCVMQYIQIMHIVNNSVAFDTVFWIVGNTVLISINSAIFVYELTHR